MSQVLSFLARHQTRRKDPVSGRFASFAAMAPEPGKLWCWKCKGWKLESEFRRDTTKRTGRQTRCKTCDNRLKTEKRKAQPVDASEVCCGQV